MRSRRSQRSDRWPLLAASSTPWGLRGFEFAVVKPTKGPFRCGASVALIADSAVASCKGLQVPADSKKARLQQAVGLNSDRRIATRRHLATASIRISSTTATSGNECTAIVPSSRRGSDSRNSRASFATSTRPPNASSERRARSRNKRAEFELERQEPHPRDAGIDLDHAGTDPRGADGER